MKSKIDRQSVIRSIITRERVGSQEGLMRLLAAEGIDVAQATLSRDLREMSISKTHDALGYRFRLPSASESVSTLRSGEGLSAGLVVSCEFCGGLCVLKTHPGHASALSALIDGKDMAPVAGTVAGDDTVLVVIRSGFGRNEVLGEMSALFGDISGKLVQD